MMEFGRKRSRLKKKSGVTTQGMKEVEVGTLGNNKNNVVINYL